ncbi:MAG: WD40 repeat domain-containing protein [Cyanobacteria bacterium P01_A01_bin.84]
MIKLSSQLIFRIISVSIFALVAIQGEKITTAQPDLSQNPVMDTSEVVTVDKNSSMISRSVAVSPDGKLMVSGDDSGKLKFWSAQTKKLLYTIPGHSNWVQSVAISPDSKMIGSGSVDGTIKLWGAKGNLLLTIRNNKPVYSVTFSPDGKLIVTGDRGGKVKLWSLNGKLLRSIDAHSGNVVSVAVNNQRRIIASRSFGDKQIKLWNINTGKLIISLDAGAVGGVNSLAISPDGKLLAGYFIPDSDGNVYSEGKVRIWRLDTGKILNDFDVNMTRPHAVSFSSNNQTLAVGGFSNSIQIWNIVTAKKINSLSSPHHTYSLTFSPDGNNLVSAGSPKGSSILIWSLSRKAQIKN